MTLSLRAALLAALTALACNPPPAAGADAGEGPAVKCARFGQSCQFAPGKLGTCVQRTNCTGDDCLVCQSQH
jgi:hypothetical protein